MLSHRSKDVRDGHSEREDEGDTGGCEGKIFFLISLGWSVGIGYST